MNDSVSTPGRHLGPLRLKEAAGGDVRRHQVADELEAKTGGWAGPLSAGSQTAPSAHQGAMALARLGHVGWTGMSEPLVSSHRHERSQRSPSRSRYRGEV